MHVHILGICGTFMGGVAKLAQQLGFRVTGSDANVYPPMSTQLQQIGIELIEGYDPKQLHAKPDQIIIGNALSRGNPCVEYILDNQLPFMSGSDWIHQHVLQNRWVLAVAGTHGKTTTSSMVAWILEYAGLNPGFLIGGVPENFGESARLGDSPFFVIEADEYDTAFFDKRSKFVHYYPKTAILNNLEFDHSDIFPDVEAIQRQFHHLVRIIPKTGLIVRPQIDSKLDEVISQGAWTPIQTFGLNGGDWQAKLNHPSGEVFTVLKQGQSVGEVQWPLVGQHNVTNGLAAIAAAHHAGVPAEVAVAALSQFVNVKRRMEVRGKIKGVTVYDDFAHHPTAVKTTIEGLRAKVGKDHVLAILDVRSNTFKAGTLKADLIQAVNAADELWIYQSADVNWDIDAIAKQMAVPVKIFKQTQDMVNAVQSVTKRDSHILIMSNGSFENLHQRLLDSLQQATTAA
jgi:UDP-N-acetylmuramate: L-alanyl-gamma-D-glutamyl-meso-diaminopimelate ligase